MNLRDKILQILAPTITGELAEIKADEIKTAFINASDIEMQEFCDDVEFVQIPDTHRPNCDYCCYAAASQICPPLNCDGGYFARKEAE